MSTSQNAQDTSVIVFHATFITYLKCLVIYLCVKANYEMNAIVK